MSIQSLDNARIAPSRVRAEELAERRSAASDRSTVKSLRKAMAVLHAVAVAERPLTIAELAVRARIARPTAYRLVQTLASGGHLVQSPVDGRLSIGFSVLPLAASLLDRNRLRLEALPHLHAVAQQTGERVNLGILHREEVLYLAGVEKPSLPTIYSRFGKTVPAHCSALGKAILAFMRNAEVAQILEARPLVGLTPATITSMPAFFEELEQTRRRGYAIDNEEAAAGTCCVGTTIFDAANQPIGAISISGRSLEALTGHVDTLRHTAEVISHML
ncbi:MAG TPA: IclR family transcriptional regulator [Xanthobacteraceae bacterium]|nr:IclR family transcriptional regulator [Xanthobacteraceae bacterium]